MASKTGVGIILAIALVFFVATIVWFVCKEAVKLCLSSAWSPANCLSRVARTTSTGVASNVNEHQTQSATAASNATVVEIEHDTPLPPDTPPPYSSLCFPTSFPGLFPFELGRREKTLASAGHVPILHPKILGVIN